MVIAAQIKRFAPNARADIVEAIVDNWSEAEAVGLTTPLRIAHFFARASVETGGLSKLEESLNYTTAERIKKTWPSRFKTVASAKPYVRQPKKLAIKVYGGRMGNRPAPATDGWDNRGSGMLQSTGAENIRKTGYTGEELRQPVPAFLSALGEWKRRGCNKLADRDDVVGVCKAINGGTIGLAEQRAELAKAKRAFGYAMPVGLIGFYEDADAEAEEIDLHAGPVPLSKTLVEAAQRRLQEDLGYRTTGGSDGNIGTLTVGAIASFQHDRGIAISGTIDAETLAEIDQAIEEGWTRPLAVARTDATTKEVREKVPAAQQSWLAKQWAKVQAIGAGGVAALFGISDNSDSAQGYLAPLRDLFSSVPPVAWALLVAGVAFAIYWLNKKGEAEIKADYQTGRTV